MEQRAEGDIRTSFVELDAAGTPAAEFGVPTQRPAPTSPPSFTTTPVRTAVPWLRGYVRLVAAADVLAVVLGIELAGRVRFGHGANIDSWPYLGFAAAGACLWMGLLGSCGAYRYRFLGNGPAEYRRVTDGSLRFLAAAVVLSYASKLNIARGYVVLAAVLGVLLLLAGRGLARLALRQQRRAGRCQHRLLVVGAGTGADELVREVRRASRSGFSIIGAFSTLRRDALVVDGVPLPVFRGTLLEAVRRSRCDTVAIASGPELSSSDVRQLAWDLEGTGVSVFLAPTLTTFSAPRVSVLPMADLPLLHLEELRLSGGSRWVKAVFDRGLAALALVLLAPLLLLIALAIRWGSAGPAIFRQQRLGRDGVPFRVYKFRTMYADAELRLAEVQLAHPHGSDGLLFKIRQDPRVTAVGRCLRRTSLDELPQLINVLAGEMSLVGPRPLPIMDITAYDGAARRRLRVLPGITGLWQVSGRSNLSWKESERLDVKYVENWSLGLDVSILVRTACAVASARGAY